jgi:hypothetical protein
MGRIRPYGEEPECDWLGLIIAALAVIAMACLGWWIADRMFTAPEPSPPVIGPDRA